MAEGTLSDSQPRQLPGARTALLLLLAINLFNYIDRYILAAILPTVETAFLQDDGNAKTKLGLLTTAFLVAYMLLAPLFGWLGDRMSRWWLIAIGVILWSLASGASGVTSLFVGSIAFGYWALLVTRCFVGVGEAAYGPVAPSLISDLFAVARSRPNFGLFLCCHARGSGPGLCHRRCRGLALGVLSCGASRDSAGHPVRVHA